MSGHVHAVAAHEEGQPLRGCPTHIVTATDANRSHVTKTEVAQHPRGDPQSPIVDRACRSCRLRKGKITEIPVISSIRKDDT
jgi:hypothetical protein